MSAITKRNRFISVPFYVVLYENLLVAKNDCCRVFNGKKELFISF